MENVLEIYHLPYDPAYPVVCMDESNKQMIGEVMQSIPCAPGQPARIDHGYLPQRGGGDLLWKWNPWQEKGM